MRRSDGRSRRANDGPKHPKWDGAVPLGGQPLAGAFDWPDEASRIVRAYKTGSTGCLPEWCGACLLPDGSLSADPPQDRLTVSRALFLFEHDASCSSAIRHLLATVALCTGRAPLFAVLAGLVDGPVSAQAGSLGPLGAEDSAPLHRVTLTAPSEVADPIRAGSMEWAVWLGDSNIFEQDSASTHVLLVDMERLITTAEVRVGLSERMELGGRITLETTGPGALTFKPARAPALAVAPTAPRILAARPSFWCCRSSWTGPFRRRAAPAIHGRSDPGST